MTKNRIKITPMRKLKNEVVKQKAEIASLNHDIGRLKQKWHDAKCEALAEKINGEQMEYKYNKLLEDFHTLTMRFLNEPKNLTFNMTSPVDKEKLEDGIEKWHEGKAG